MRRDYYDPVDERTVPGTPPTGDWTPVAPPQPYGPVPGTLLVEPEPLPSPPKRRHKLFRRRRAGWRGPRRKRAWVLFGSFLALILAVALTGFFWLGGPEGLWDRNWGPARDPWEDPVPSLPPVETTVERAPVGGGTALELAALSGEDLPPQEIYERVVHSIVGIRATREGGVALGTGVILSPDGYIITNAHVVEGSFRVDVVFSDDTRKNALLVGMDGDTDLAVLKIDALGLPAAEFGDSSALRVGDAAYAIGNPLGEELRGTMTDGMISAIDRAVTVSGSDMTLIQTTAALNTGNSGGALVSAGGQVVGITNMKMMSNWNTIEGLGFAIPSTQVKAVADQIMEKGYYTASPSLGVVVSNYRPDPNAPEGAYVESVERYSGAYERGVRPGDVIVEAGGRRVTSVDDLLRAKEGLKEGDVLELKLWTGRGERTVKVPLMDPRHFAPPGDGEKETSAP